MYESWQTELRNNMIRKQPRLRLANIHIIYTIIRRNRATDIDRQTDRDG